MLTGTLVTAPSTGASEYFFESAAIRVSAISIDGSAMPGFFASSLERALFTQLATSVQGPA